MRKPLSIDQKKFVETCWSGLTSREVNEIFGLKRIQGTNYRKKLKDSGIELPRYNRSGIPLDKRCNESTKPKKPDTKGMKPFEKAEALLTWHGRLVKSNQHGYVLDGHRATVQDIMKAGEKL